MTEHGMHQRSELIPALRDAAYPCPGNHAAAAAAAAHTHTHTHTHRERERENENVRNTAQQRRTVNPRQLDRQPKQSTLNAIRRLAKN